MCRCGAARPARTVPSPARLHRHFRRQLAIAPRRSSSPRHLSPASLLSFKPLQQPASASYLRRTASRLRIPSCWPCRNGVERSSSTWPLARATKTMSRSSRRSRIHRWCQIGLRRSRSPCLRLPQHRPRRFPLPRVHDGGHGTGALEPPLSYAGQGKGKAVVRSPSPSPSPMSRSLSPPAPSAKPRFDTIQSFTPPGSSSREAASAVTGLNAQTARQTGISSFAGA